MMLTRSSSFPLEGIWGYIEFSYHQSECPRKEIEKGKKVYYFSSSCSLPPITCLRECTAAGTCASWISRIEAISEAPRTKHIHIFLQMAPFHSSHEKEFWVQKAVLITQHDGLSMRSTYTTAMATYLLEIADWFS